MTLRLANDVIIIPVLPKNPLWKIVRIKYLQEFLKSDHWLRRYCILSGGVFYFEPPCTCLACGLTTCDWDMADVLVCWTGVKAWDCPMRVCGAEFTISGASPLAPGTGLKSTVCNVAWPGHWLAVVVNIIGLVSWFQKRPGGTWHSWDGRIPGVGGP